MPLQLLLFLFSGCIFFLFLVGLSLLIRNTTSKLLIWLMTVLDSVADAMPLEQIRTHCRINHGQACASH